MGLTRFLAKRLTDYHDPRSLASRIRRRRILPLLDMIEAAHARFQRVDILDIGGTTAYWNIVPADVFARRAVTVTLVNLEDSPASVDGGHFKAAVGDGCDLSHYPDNSFHITHSNSVLEHVGDWGRMAAFAREVRRLAPDYFVQTPYFWFPVEPHFMAPLFHWLPEPLRVGLAMRFSLGHFERASSVDDAVRNVQGIRLIDRRMFRHLFPDAAVSTERVLLMPKSLLAIRRSHARTG
jgi:hypothetical protein